MKLSGYISRCVSFLPTSLSNPFVFAWFILKRKCYKLSFYYRLFVVILSYTWQRIIFKLLLFVYKILNNQAPKYLDTCLNLYTPTRSLRSSSDPLRFTYSVTRTLAGDHRTSASKYCNDLPFTVRQSSSVSAFRKALKHIFLVVCNCNVFLTTCIYNCFLIDCKRSGPYGKSAV